MMQHTNLDQSIELAEAVQNQLVRTAGRKNNGVRQAPFWVLVRTSMPAILVELDFICNPAMGSSWLRAGTEEACTGYLSRN